MVLLCTVRIWKQKCAQIQTKRTLSTNIRFYPYLSLSLSINEPWDNSFPCHTRTTNMGEQINITCFLWGTATNQGTALTPPSLRAQAKFALSTPRPRVAMASLGFKHAFLLQGDFADCYHICPSPSSWLLASVLEEPTEQTSSNLPLVFCDTDIILMTKKVKHDRVLDYKTLLSI